MRSRKVLKCCWASTVVGTSTATCRPPITALNAARIATSVLPKPTSPQIRRSIGRVRSMSALASLMAFQLVGRFLEEKRCLELALPGGVRWERVAGLGIARGLDREEFRREIGDLSRRGRSTL
jgi:hypothetical protein